MKNFIILAISFSFFISCGNQEEQSKNDSKYLLLEGTKWVCEIDEGCVNTYEFKSDSTFVFYSCEMDEKSFGQYYFKDSILVLDQNGIGNNIELSSQFTERKRYEIHINGEVLKHLNMSNYVNGRWVKSNFKFDEKYVFKKL